MTVFGPFATYTSQLDYAKDVKSRMEWVKFPWRAFFETVVLYRDDQHRKDSGMRYAVCGCVRL